MILSIHKAGACTRTLWKKARMMYATCILEEE